MKSAFSLAICLLFSIGLVYGQEKKEKKEAWEKAMEKSMRKMTSKLDDDSRFLLMEAPEKWNKESAVILMHYLKVTRGREKSGGGAVPGLYSRIYERTRILLNDQFAINDFSSFELTRYEILEITVIKPDGSRVVFDKSRAVKADMRIEDNLSLTDFSITTSTKIPVPGLEPGDIIEIERFSENMVERTGKPVHTSIRNIFHIFPLNEIYPVYHRVIDIELEDPYRLNWRSMNGAPDIKLVKQKEKVAIYRFEDSLRARNKAEFWSPGNMKNPFVKFAIAKYSSGLLRGELVLKEKEPLKEITPDQLLGFVYHAHRDEENSHSNIYRDFIMANREVDMSDDEVFIRKFYEYYRAYIYVDVLEIDDVMNNIQFLKIMRRVLEKRKIEYEYILAVPKTLGKLNEAISLNEFTWALRIKESGMIINAFNAWSNLGEMQQRIFGTEVYVFQPAESKKRMTVETELLPADEPANNHYYFQIRARFDSSFTNLVVERENSLAGYARYAYVDDMPYTIFEEDILLLHGDMDLELNVPIQYYEDMSSVEHEDEMDRLKKSFFDEVDHNTRENMKDRISNQHFKVEDYTKLEIVQSGRFGESDKLVFKETFEISGLNTKAGEYFVVDLGRLLGQQMEIIDSEDSLRTQDIYLSFPRKIEYELKFEIPGGMKVDGAENFNVRVENEAGSYVVTSEVREGLVIVKAVKTYNKDILDKNEWNKVMDFVNAASDLNNKKIILSR